LAVAFRSGANRGVGLNACILVRTIKASTKQAPAFVFESCPPENLKVPLLSLKGSTAETETIDLNPEVFGVPVRRDVIHQVAVWHLANRRKGTANSKTRGDVRGTTKKAFRQKGTGKARRGDMRSPMLIGGGVAHGPKPRDWSYSMNKKVRRLAMRSVLSGKLLEGRLWIFEDFELEHAKTQLLFQRLEELGIRNALFVDGEEFHDSPEFFQASKNIPWMQLVSGLRANVVEILRRENVVLSRRALQHLEKRLLVH